MALPTNVTKYGKNNVSYDYNENTYKVGIHHVERKTLFHTKAIERYEGREDLVTLHTNQLDFYQHIKDEYDKQ